MRAITRRRFLDLTARADLGLGAARALGARGLAAASAAASDSFLVPHADFALYPLVFGREKGAVVEASHGADWYAGERFQGARPAEAPAEWQAYAGHYRNEDPWQGSTRVVLRQGRLWLGGTTPLTPLCPGLFRIGEEEHTPDRIRFEEVVRGRALRAVASGTELRRLET